jgi:hypothetical protein
LWKVAKVVWSDLGRGDVILVRLPAHQPSGREQEGQRPAVIVGIALRRILNI